MEFVVSNFAFFLKYAISLFHFVFQTKYALSYSSRFSEAPTVFTTQRRL